MRYEREKNNDDDDDDDDYIMFALITMVKISFKKINDSFGPKSAMMVVMVTD